jgi:A/G-specific adenine glycosylase
VRAWAKTNGRQFEWRLLSSTWHLFLAEMLLRRTRAEQVADHLPAIVGRFPQPADLARARWSTVERVFRPLGLTWRTRSLHRASKQIVKHHNGELPLQEELLLEFPGVGPYVARATIACATGRRVTLTDTNTVRVACRVAGIPITGDIRRRRDVQQAINDLLGGPAKAQDWWGVLDLAQKVCLPRNPLCHECPIHESCALGKARSSQGETTVDTNASR